MLLKPLPFRRQPPAPPWSDTAPVRQELFGIERLEQHAKTLAAAQPVTATPSRVLSLQRRLDNNAAVLLAAYRASAAELESGRGVVPAAEWLLDNYHLVEEQIREIRDDLPPGYYRQLPKLAAGPFAGYPRVFGLAWAFVAHTDSHFDPAALRRFIAAYQTRAAAHDRRIVGGRDHAAHRADREPAPARRPDHRRPARAHRCAGAGEPAARPGPRPLGAGYSTSPRASAGPLSELFAAQLAKRLRDQDPRTTPALGWLEERLRLQGTSIDEVVEHAQQRQGASNVTVRNIITSMRLISDIDWAELFESVSLVDERLRAGSAFAAMDFATRNLYRSAIEQLARGSALSELDIADPRAPGLRRGRSRYGGRGAGRARRRPRLSPDRRRAAGLRARHRFHAAPAAGDHPLQHGLGIGGYVGAILLVATVVAGARPAGRVERRRGCRLARAACRIGAGGLRSRDRGGDRAGQPHDRPGASARSHCPAWRCATASRPTCARWSPCRRC